MTSVPHDIGTIDKDNQLLNRYSGNFVYSVKGLQNYQEHNQKLDIRAMGMLLLANISTLKLAKKRSKSDDNQTIGIA